MLLGGGVLYGFTGEISYFLHEIFKTKDKTSYGFPTFHRRKKNVYLSVVVVVFCVVSDGLAGSTRAADGQHTYGEELIILYLCIYVF